MPRQGGFTVYSLSEVFQIDAANLELFEINGVFAHGRGMIGRIPTNMSIRVLQAQALYFFLHH